MDKAARPQGFTLIELLIVVAIIAILAAIAVPNFLEAQVRAKVSRAKTDLRTIATGLEAYGVDSNHYPPNDGAYNVTPIQLSTPVAYLSTSILFDPFTSKELVQRPGLDPELAKQYTYTKVVTEPEADAFKAQTGKDCPPEGIDSPAFHRGAFQKYGQWRLASNGPDRIYNQAAPPPAEDAFNERQGVLFGCDIPYDPTNGTVSFGNVLRTELAVEGFRLKN